MPSKSNNTTRQSFTSALCQLARDMAIKIPACL